MDASNNYSHRLNHTIRPVILKLVPPKFGLSKLILAEKPAKTGPPDHFYCQIGPHLPKSVLYGGLILEKSAKISPPHSGTLIHVCSYGYLQYSPTTTSYYYALSSMSMRA